MDNLEDVIYVNPADGTRVPVRISIGRLTRTVRVVSGATAADKRMLLQCPRRQDSSIIFVKPTCTADTFPIVGQASTPVNVIGIEHKSSDSGLYYGEFSSVYDDLNAVHGMIVVTFPVCVMDVLRRWIRDDADVAMRLYNQNPRGLRTRLCAFGQNSIGRTATEVAFLLSEDNVRSVQTGVRARRRAVAPAAVIDLVTDDEDDRQQRETNEEQVMFALRLKAFSDAVRAFPSLNDALHAVTDPALTPGVFADVLRVLADSEQMQDRLQAQYQAVAMSAYKFPQMSAAFELARGAFAKVKYRVETLRAQTAARGAEFERRLFDRVQSSSLCPSFRGVLYTIRTQPNLYTSQYNGIKTQLSLWERELADFRVELGTMSRFAQNARLVDSIADKLAVLEAMLHKLKTAFARAGSTVRSLAPWPWGFKASGPCNWTADTDSEPDEGGGRGGGYSEHGAGYSEYNGGYSGGGGGSSGGGGGISTGWPAEGDGTAEKLVALMRLPPPAEPDPYQVARLFPTKRAFTTAYRKATLQLHPDKRLEPTAAPFQRLGNLADFIRDLQEMPNGGGRRRHIRKRCSAKRSRSRSSMKSRRHRSRRSKRHVSRRMAV